MKSIGKRGRDLATWKRAQIKEFMTYSKPDYCPECAKLGILRPYSYHKPAVHHLFKTSDYPELKMERWAVAIGCDHKDCLGAKLDQVSFPERCALLIEHYSEFWRRAQELKGPHRLVA